MSEIKPCLCGRPANVMQIDYLPGGNPRYTVGCNDWACQWSAGEFDTEATAIAAWNQRAGEAELAALRENVETLARIAYANGCLSTMRAAELTGISLPDIMHQVQSGEWPQQGELVDAERETLRNLREAVHDYLSLIPDAPECPTMPRENMRLALAICDKTIQGNKQLFNHAERLTQAAGEHPLDEPTR